MCSRQCSLRVDHHKGLAPATVKDTGVVEAGNIHEHADVVAAAGSRCGRHIEGQRGPSATHPCLASQESERLFVALFLVGTSFSSDANVGLTDEVLLVASIGDDSADEEILVFRPIGQRHNGRVQVLLVLVFSLVLVDDGNVVQDLGKANVASLGVGLYRAA